MNCVSCQLKAMITLFGLSSLIITAFASSTSEDCEESEDIDFLFEELDLSDSGLNSFDFSLVCDASGSKSVEQLILSSNWIQYLWNTDLRNCKELKLLDLSYNEWIKTYENDIYSGGIGLKFFKSLHHLESLDLNGIQLNIDIEWIFKTLIQINSPLKHFIFDSEKSYGKLNMSDVCKTNIVDLRGGFSATYGFIYDVEEECDNLEQLWLNANNAAIPSSILQFVTNNKLRSLTFVNNRNYHVNTAEIGWDIGQVLTHLTVSTSNRDASLKYIKLSQNGISGTLDFEQLCQTSNLQKKLQVLDLTSNDLTQVINEASIAKCTKLKYLSFNSNENLQLADTSLFRFATQLESLHLEETGLNKNIEDIMLQLLHSRSNLKHFSARGSKVSGILDFNVVCQTNLQSLDLSETEINDFANIDALKHCTRLKSLTLQNLQNWHIWCNFFGKYGYQFFQNAVYLEHLDLEGMEMEGAELDQIFYELSDCGSNITELTLDLIDFYNTGTIKFDNLKNTNIKHLQLAIMAFGRLDYGQLSQATNLQVLQFGDTTHTASSYPLTDMNFFVSTAHLKEVRFMSANSLNFNISDLLQTLVACNWSKQILSNYYICIE